MLQRNRIMLPLKQKAPYIFSIPHNATRWLTQTLPLNVGYGHTHHANVRNRLDKATIVVVPLRDPRKVWESWWKRNPKTETEMRFRGEYACMNYIDSQRTMYYMPVDVLNREECLTLLGRIVAQELETDWTPVGEYDGVESGKPVPEIDLSEIYAYPFISRHYRQN